jgi:hypothetical protein
VIFGLFLQKQKADVFLATSGIPWEEIDCILTHFNGIKPVKQASERGTQDQIVDLLAEVDCFICSTGLPFEVGTWSRIKKDGWQAEGWMDPLCIFLHTAPCVDLSN